MVADVSEFAPPGTRRLCVMRDGHAVVRDWQIPKPTVLVDTREQQPFDLAGRHPSWIVSGRLKCTTPGRIKVYHPKG